MLKTTTLFKLLIIFYIFNVFKSDDDCSIVYVSLLLSNRFLYDYENIANTTGFTLISNFIDGCVNNGRRKFVLLDLFEFTINDTKICLTDDIYMCTNHLGNCDNCMNSLTFNNVNLYNVKEQFEKEIGRESHCLKNSMVIFLTDIPCNNFTQYLDVNKMFGQDNLSGIRSFLKEKRIQTYLVFLMGRYKLNEYLGCNYMTELVFKHNSNYFEAKYVHYDKVSMEDTGKIICGTEFPGPPYIPPSTDKKDGLSGIVITLCSVFFLIFWTFVVFWVTQIKRRIREAKIEAFAEQHTTNISHLLFGRYMDEWQISPRELKVEQDKILGKGIFGIVYKGFLKKKRGDELLEMEVAVKFPHEHANDVVRENMLKEISFMKALGKHENLLTMIAYIKSIENPVIVTQYCSNADLLGILKRHKIHFMSKQRCEEVEICLLLPNLIRIALQICSGLIHVAKMKFIHRDVAARNVLLTDNLTAKLSDFGLSCQFNTEYLSVIEKKGRFPVKNMPFEALRHGEFSEKSDVWSFGLLIFEMLSGGQRPFDQIPIEEFVEFLENDGKSPNLK